MRTSPIRISLCSNHYGPRITPAILDWVRAKFASTTIPIQAKELQQLIRDTFGISVSITTVYRILHRELSMSYKRVYRCEVRANAIKSKQQRQLASVLYVRELSTGIDPIYLCLTLTCL